MQEAQSVKPRSSFISVLAWIFIVIASFVTLISLFQNIILNTLFPLDEMRSSMAEMKSKQQVPFLAQFMFEHIRVIVALFFVLSALTLSCAIGLLKRKNWARIIFIGILAVGIVWNVAGFIFSLFLFSSASSLPANMPSAGQDDFETMKYIMIGFNGVFAAGFSVLFGWIIKRLLSKQIRYEFLTVQ